MFQLQTTDSRAARPGALDGDSSGGYTQHSACAAALLGPEPYRECSHGAERRDIWRQATCFVISRWGFESPRQLPPRPAATGRDAPIKRDASVQTGAPAFSLQPSRQAEREAYRVSATALSHRVVEPTRQRAGLSRPLLPHPMVPPGGGVKQSPLTLASPARHAAGGRKAYLPDSAKPTGKGLAEVTSRDHGT